MFNWEKLKDYGIAKLNQDEKVLIDSLDGIHCSECGEHLSDHGKRGVGLYHPMDIANLINTEKE
jgi:hypothetical protein